MAAEASSKSSVGIHHKPRLAQVTKMSEGIKFLNQETLSQMEGKTENDINNSIEMNEWSYYTYIVKVLTNTLSLKFALGDVPI